MQRTDDENRNKFFSKKAVFFFFSIEKNFVSFEKQDNCRFGGKSLDKFQKFEYDNNVNWKKHSSSAEFPVL